MSRLIHISDLHHRHRLVQTLLDKETYDRVVFTGDFFDQWNDTTDEVHDAAVWLRDSLRNPKHVHLFGNHDFGWMWPANDNVWRTAQPGSAKMHAIRSVLTQDDFDLIRLYHAEQGILFSHAGLDAYMPQYLASKGYEYPKETTLDGITAWLDQQWPLVKQLYSVGRIHPLMEPGQCRGGEQKVGGMIWRHFNDTHMPIPGVAQLVGHSIQDDCPLFRLSSKDGGQPASRKASHSMNPRWLAPGGWTLCMDTCNRHYAIIEDGTLTINEVRVIKPTRVGQGATAEPGKTLLSTRYL